MAGELTHVGFIADGNRRWARSHGLPTLEGHRRGAIATETIIDYFKNSEEVKFVSFFVFSTENWDRSAEEIDYLMKLLSEKIEKLAKTYDKQNVRLTIMGRPEPVDPDIWARLMKAEEDTKDNTGLTVCICFNYGGKWEIADAATKAISAGETALTPETFAKYLYHPEVPACDMIVRTSGEQRISGFQLWRAAYAEFLFLENHFPEITAQDCDFVLEEFHRRNRRFGK